MKKQKFKAIALVSIVLLLLMPSAWAQDEVTKEFHESYSADNSTKLVIENKYGNVDIKDWDQNQVKIDVIVKVKHSNSEKAAKILESIEVTISESGNEIKAVTSIEDKLRNLSNNNSEISIDYTVQMPADIDIDIANKYGNVFISEVTGHAIVTVKYGNLTANRIFRGKEKPLSEVNLRYSEASSLEEADWLKINMKYAHLNIDKAKALVLVSGYSEVSVDEASSIVSEGAYDEYRFGKLDNFVTTIKYSEVDIEELSDELNCESKYTHFKVDYMPAGFESIKINNGYGSFKIGIDESASYKLNGEASYAKIGYHDTGRVSRISENNSMSVNGTVGTDSNTASFVKISTRYGSVRLDD